MRISSPHLPKEPLRVDNFSSYVRDFLSDESPVIEIESCEERIEGADFYKIEIRRSIFRNCVFLSCSFENSCFIDVVFQSCDLSNSKFAGAYFERCRFISCKCIGLDMSDTAVRQTSFEQSNFQYSNFNKAGITDILFDHIDFTESTMAEAKLSRLEARGSRFVKNNFFKTMLAAVDFSNNEFTAPTVSSPPVELKGAVVNAVQAADLIGLWGVIVKQ